MHPNPDAIQAATARTYSSLVSQPASTSTNSHRMANAESQLLPEGIDKVVVVDCILFRAIAHSRQALLHSKQSPISAEQSMVDVGGVTIDVCEEIDDDPLTVFTISCSSSTGTGDISKPQRVRSPLGPQFMVANAQ